MSILNENWEKIKLLRWAPIKAECQLYLDNDENIFVIREGGIVKVLAYGYIENPNLKTLFSYTDFYAFLNNVRKLAYEKWEDFRILVILNFTQDRILSHTPRLQKEYPEIEFYYFNGKKISQLLFNPEIKLKRWRFSDTPGLFEEEYGYQGGTLYLHFLVDGVLRKAEISASDIESTLYAAGIVDDESIGGDPFVYSVDGLDLDEYFAQHFNNAKANQLVQIIGKKYEYSKPVNE